MCYDLMIHDVDGDTDGPKGKWYQNLLIIIIIIIIINIVNNENS